MDEGPGIRDEGFPATQPKPRWPWPLAAQAVLGGLLLMVPLWRANLELDHTEPHQTPARLFLLATLVLAALLGVLLVRGLRRVQGAAAGLLGLALGLPAIVLATDAATDYGRQSQGFKVLDFSGESFAFLLISYAVALAVVGIIAATLTFLHVRRWPGMLFTIVGIAIATSMALAAVVMLATFPDQVEAAREANRDTPSLGFAVGAILLLLLAQRRSPARRR